jgi:hypothetical protein
MPWDSSIGSGWPATGDEEIATRINAYEMAYRMQTSAPELMDTAGETRATLELYGIKDGRETSFARNCLLARRLVERGVRFVQLYDTNWDHHGGPSENLEKHLPEKCQRHRPGVCGARPRSGTTRACSRTPSSCGGANSAAPPWGKSASQPAAIITSTRSRCGSRVAGFTAARSTGRPTNSASVRSSTRSHVRDIHATLLHQLGLDHQQLSVRSQGLDLRLTGVTPARVIQEIVS